MALRICKTCGKEVKYEGYVMYDGEEYYCSRECLLKEMSWEQYIALYEADEAYYTVFEEQE